MAGGTSETVTNLQQKRTGKAPPPDLDDPRYYVNRELGLLNFQWRVLEEAQDAGNPLLERVKFLSIVGSNLDEFFMVRVASLTAQVDAGILEFGPDRMSPARAAGGHPPRGQTPDGSGPPVPGAANSSRRWPKRASTF